MKLHFFIAAMLICISRAFDVELIEDGNLLDIGNVIDSSKFKLVEYSISPLEISKDLAGIEFEIVYVRNSKSHRVGGFSFFIPYFALYYDSNENGMFDGKDRIVQIFPAHNHSKEQFLNLDYGDDHLEEYFMELSSYNWSFNCRTANTTETENEREGFGDDLLVDPSKFKCNLRFFNLSVDSNYGIGIVMIDFTKSKVSPPQNKIESNHHLKEVDEGDAFFLWDTEMEVLNMPYASPNIFSTKLPVKSHVLEITAREFFKNMYFLQYNKNMTERYLERTVDLKKIATSLKLPGIFTNGFDTVFEQFIFSCPLPKGTQHVLWDPEIGVLLSGTQGGDHGDGGDGIFHSVGTYEIIWIIAWSLFIVIGVIMIIVIAVYYSSKSARRFINGTRRRKSTRVSNSLRSSQANDVVL